MTTKKTEPVTIHFDFGCLPVVFTIGCALIASSFYDASVCWGVAFVAFAVFHVIACRRFAVRAFSKGTKEDNPDPR